MKILQIVVIFFFIKDEKKEMMDSWERILESLQSSLKLT